MPDLGYYKPETAAMILDVVKHLQESGLVRKSGQKERRSYPPDTPIYVRNDSGEEVPKFACVQATGTVEIDGQNFVTIEKPVDTTGDAGPFLFNMFAPIETGGYGNVSAGPQVRALGLSGASAGDLYEPTIGDWSVQAGGNFIRAIGDDDIDTGIGRGVINGSGAGISSIEWRATDRIANRIVQVEVTHLRGTPKDPTTGDPLEVGDTLSIHDVQNRWPTICKGCSGIATYKEATLVDEPVAGDPATPARYEIDTATEPITVFDGEIKGGYMTKSTGNVTVTIQNPLHASQSNYVPGSPNLGGPQNHIVRSHHTARVLPQELDFSGGPTLTIQASNREDLDGMGECTVIRTNDAHQADPENRITPRVGSETSYEYRVVWVKRRKARHIEGEWAESPSPVTITMACEGENPTAFGSIAGEFSLAFDAPCPIKEGEPFYAYYCAEEDKYRIVSATPALMAIPETVYVIDGGDSVGNGPSFTGCTLGFEVVPSCGWPKEDPVSKTAAIATQSLEVITDAELQLSNLKLYFDKATIQVCAFGAANPDEIDLTTCPTGSGPS